MAAPLIAVLDHTENDSKEKMITQINANFAALAATLAAGAADLAVSSGTFTANGATPVAVAAPGLTVNSQILITLKTAHSPGGTSPAAGPYETAVTPGTGFSVAATAGDVSVYNWMIIG